ncbi:MAG: beta-lactamase domain protein [Myxococcales bacterium]|nr:beta-lactamase domain protein [Myxococcales bacterium]
MASGVTQQVNDGGEPFTVEGAPWIRVVPLRTPTLPPATRTNCYLVGDAGRAIAIDPATPYSDEQDRLDDFVQLHNIRLSEIVLTHHHLDHVGDATRLAAKHGVGIAAHAVTADKLRGRVAVTREIADGERLDVGPRGLRAKFTPGHAPGHLCFVDEAASSIVAGDMVASLGTIIVEPDDGGDMRIYLESLQALRAEVAAGMRRLLPAHGAPVDDGGALLDHYVAHRLGREARVAAALTGEAQEVVALVPPAYPDVSPALYGLAARSLLAHLIKLEYDGHARRHADGRWSRA